MKRALVLALAALAACYDPVHEDAVANLGPEVPGVPRGPLHRAGQPCTTCHSVGLEGGPVFSIAGTLYERRGQPTPLVGGRVTVTDARGTSITLASNEVGNFYVEEREFDPVYPLRVAISFGDVRREMITSISREGGCGACHRGAGDQTLMPGVFLRDL